MFATFFLLPTLIAIGSILVITNLVLINQTQHLKRKLDQVNEDIEAIKYNLEIDFYKKH